MDLKRLFTWIWNIPNRIVYAEELTVAMAVVFNAYIWRYDAVVCAYMASENTETVNQILSQAFSIRVRFVALKHMLCAGISNPLFILNAIRVVLVWNYSQ